MAVPQMRHRYPPSTAPSRTFLSGLVFAQTSPEVAGVVGRGRKGAAPWPGRMAVGTLRDGGRDTSRDIQHFLREKNDHLIADPARGFMTVLFETLKLFQFLVEKTQCLHTEPQAGIHGVPEA